MSLALSRSGTSGGAFNAHWQARDYCSRKHDVCCHIAQHESTAVAIELRSTHSPMHWP
ncbi:hypothetical protein XVE_0494 [Xanthomonas vesicatoria ATCC 35937]|uniref:Uncharacterized protein n=1 Tax=Xanthomonas vesicatoria ATCC 35937 TaxID=925775 RepID=F0B8U3_9XANT|nr:hypothetical protein XVE_0494 [Xanthomonas vesicatoria ATCC 35937]